MKIKEVIAALEERFPLYLQKEFDNSGIQCGDAEQEITGALVCYEMSEKVLDEAIDLNANLLLSHHPLIIRKGIYKITPQDRVGKLICKALAHNMVLYSMHTNLDAAEGGGNDMFAERLGLHNVSVLEPINGLYRKIVFFSPHEQTDKIKQALFLVGGGALGHYDHCHYTMSGQGTFRPLEGAKPYAGTLLKEETVNEDRVEIIFSADKQRKIIEALYETHPYEEPAFDIIPLENPSRYAGMGRIGSLNNEMTTKEFLQYLKTQMQLKHLRYYGDERKTITKVAICGGGGASLINMAMTAGADAYVCGDVKYHDFISAEKKMLICDIGHYESEFFIREIIYKELAEKFTTFAVALSKKEDLEIYFL